MAPVQLAWFGFLARLFPIGLHNKTSAAIWRVAFDQLIFSPVGLLLFFAFMSTAEGGGAKALRRKLNAVFLSAL